MRSLPGSAAMLLADDLTYQRGLPCNDKALRGKPGYGGYISYRDSFERTNPPEFETRFCYLWDSPISGLNGAELMVKLNGNSLKCFSSMAPGFAVLFALFLSDYL